MKKAIVIVALAAVAMLLTSCTPDDISSDPTLNSTVVKTDIVLEIEVKLSELTKYGVKLYATNQERTSLATEVIDEETELPKEYSITLDSGEVLDVDYYGDFLMVDGIKYVSTPGKTIVLN